MAGERIRAAVVQMLADTDTTRNIARMHEFVEAAALAGAQIAVLPEKWNWWGAGAATADGAEPLDGPSLTAARGWARDLGIAIVAGSVLEAFDSGIRAFNTSVLIGPDGADVAVYRKIHLFDGLVDDHEYHESAAIHAGADVVTGEVLGMRVGLSVCYDLRFPELYRAHATAGARALAVPANFTLHTGEAHWEILLRARAVENQCFVLAAGQCGTHATGEAAWGHSMIVDPWGRVLAQVAEGEGFAAADLDLSGQDAIRASLPVLAHRRL